MSNPDLVIVETFDLNALPASAAIRQVECALCLKSMNYGKFGVRVEDRHHRITYYAHQGCAREQGAVSPSGGGIMQTWRRAGSGPAHWIKLAGHWCYTTACEVLLPKNADEVETQRTGIGGGVKSVDLPTEGEVCPACKQKAMEQA